MNDITVPTANQYWPFLRFVLGAGAAVALGYGAAVLTLVGGIVFTGCFFECTDPNLAGGALILAGAAATAASAITALVAGLAGKRAPLRAVFLGTAAAAVMALVILISGF